MSATIVAAATSLASAAAVGVIRLSGDNALAIAKTVFTSLELDWNKIVPRMMYLGTVRTQIFSDKAFCVYYKAPISYTGEDVIELQTHGGISLVNGVVRALIQNGAEPADPGEFTKRAFLNGKLSLDEAEGVADIINAQSEAEIMQAYRMLSGELSRGIFQCEQLLLGAAANLEAVLDYPEELEQDTKSPTLSTLIEVQSQLKAIEKTADNRKYVTDGITICIAGLPNVGKSSILNALLNDQRAIVTDIAGTTRDTLCEHIDINGIWLNIIDTAGIRESSDTIEKIGIERAKSAIASADLVLFVMDLSQPQSAEELALRNDIVGKKTIFVANKKDIARYPRATDIEISAHNRINIDALISHIFAKIDIPTIATSSVLMRDRHIFAVKHAIAALNDAISSFSKVTIDCTIVDIKSAYRSLAEITGSDATESIIDKIFSQFCVGK